MSSKNNKRTQVLLLAVAVTGLVFTGLMSTAYAHHAGETVDRHALSRTFPGPEQRTVICSETVLSILGLDEPKDPTNPKCDQNNPNWLSALKEKTTTGLYYERERIHVLNPEWQNEVIGEDPKVGVRAGGTAIAQSALICTDPVTVLGEEIPGFVFVQDCLAKPDTVEWYLNACEVGNAEFVNQRTGDLTLSDQATAIDCLDEELEGKWINDTPVNVTKYISNFGPTTVSTGFWEPYLEAVVEALMTGPGKPGGGKEAFPNSYMVSVLKIGEVLEFDDGGFPHSISHTEERLSGNSHIDSHDWFTVLNPFDVNGDIEKNDCSWLDIVPGLGGACENVVYDLSGSDVQAGDRAPFYGPGKPPSKK